MARRIDVIVLDMLKSIEWIEEDTKGITKPDFEATRVTQQVVERNMEIISEASRRIPDEIKAKFANVPWRSIAGVGNFLRHEYYEIRPSIIWCIVKDDLPELKTALRSILADMRRSNDPT